MHPRAFDGRRPFTRADALAAGVAPAMLRGSRFRRLFRGVYVDRTVHVDETVRALGALAVHPAGAFASHHSAARVLRIPVPDTPEEHVTVSRPGDRRPRPGIRSHVAPSGVRVITHRGVRVSDAVGTFLALASRLSLVDLVIAGDAMVRLNLVTTQQLREAAKTSSGWDVVSARRAAQLVRAGVDSPMETRLRLLIVLAGLPEPHVNHIVRTGSGEWIVRFDLSYPWLKLAVEYDGRQHADDTTQWHRDIERREYLDRAGWRLVVVTAKGIFMEPGRTVQRVYGALRERGCTTLPRVPSQAWQPHFLRRG